MFGTPESTPETRADSTLLDVTQIATRLGTGERFARRLLDERRIPTVKVGRYVRVWSHDLEDYLAANTRPPHQEFGGRND